MTRPPAAASPPTGEGARFLKMGEIQPFLEIPALTVEANAITFGIYALTAEFDTQGRD